MQEQDRSNSIEFSHLLIMPIGRQGHEKPSACARYRQAWVKAEGGYGEP